MLYNFKEHGFIIVKNVFNNHTLEKIRELADRIIAYGKKGLEDPFRDYYLRHRVDQGVLYDLFQRHPEFQDLAKNQQILHRLEKVLGEDIFLYENSLVYKPRGGENAVPWHQDFINRPHEPRKFIAWIALDKISKENGAMKIVPGSHKLGFLPWHHVPDETHHTRVNLEGIDLSLAIYTELDPGDVLIFNQLVLHGSDKVDTYSPRRAYRVSYQGFDKIYTPRGTPIVLKGGSPESLMKKYNHPNSQFPNVMIQNKQSLVKRILHKIGRKLLTI